MLYKNPSNTQTLKATKLKFCSALYLLFVCFQVNNTDVSGMNHTEVVNLVRAAPKVVDLVVGRILEPPKPPIEAHLLPDITFQCHDESLGNGKYPCTL